MDLVKVWFLTPEINAILVETLPKDFGLEEVKYLLKCDMVEYQGFTAPDGNCYAIYADEEGMFSSKKNNLTAKKLLSKINLNWGTFKGNFIVFSYRHEGENEVNRDMDITPKEFVEKFNDALK